MTRCAAISWAMLIVMGLAPSAWAADGEPMFDLEPPKETEYIGVWRAFMAVVA